MTVRVEPCKAILIIKGKSYDCSMPFTIFIKILKALIIAYKCIGKLKIVKKYIHCTLQFKTLEN